MSRKMYLVEQPAPARNGILIPASTPPAPIPAPGASPWGDWATARCVLLTVTPEEALEILADHNPRNRSISEMNVKRLRAELREGRWAVNGATLVFDGAGNLLDGQHRLRACVDEGIAIATYVLFGAEEDAFTTIDRGRARQAGDDLHVLGETNTSNLAATLALVFLEEAGRLDQVGVVPPFPVLRQVLERHPDVRDSCHLIAKRRDLRKILTPRIATYCHYGFARKDAAAAYIFFEDLTVGAGLGKDDPVLLLRNRLIQARANGKDTIKPVETLALCIKAWNYRRADATVMSLRWRQSGPGAESFPTIK